MRTDQHIIAPLVEIVGLESLAVVPQPDVDTDVGLPGLLPCDVHIGLETLRHALIEVSVEDIGSAVDVHGRGVLERRTRQIARLAPRGAELQVVQPRKVIFDERLLAHAPSRRHRREETEFLALGEIVVPVVASGGLEQVFVVVLIGDAVDVTHLRGLRRSAAVAPVRGVGVTHAQLGDVQVEIRTRGAQVAVVHLPGLDDGQRRHGMFSAEGVRIGQHALKGVGLRVGLTLGQTGLLGRHHRIVDVGQNVGVDGVIGHFGLVPRLLEDARGVETEDALRLEPRQERQFLLHGELGEDVGVLVLAFAGTRHTIGILAVRGAHQSVRVPESVDGLVLQHIGHHMRLGRLGCLDPAQVAVEREFDGRRTGGLGLEVEQHVVLVHV